MKSISQLFLAFALSLAFAVPALSATITAPLDGATVSNPFSLIAAAPTCNSLPTTALGYSIDQGATTYVSNPYTGLVLTSVGTHTLHLKSQNSTGHVCTKSVNVTVTDTAPADLPSGVTAGASIQNLTSWRGTHDAGTPGTSTGKMTITSSPSLSGSSRHFTQSYTSNGGERFAVDFGKDTLAHYFIYDARIFLASPVNLSNLELDMNQVTASGYTIIYAFQCAGWANVWEYTLNSGTLESPHGKWYKSTLPCSPTKWTPDTWHHVQIAYFRDDKGYVTYQTVVLDGVAHDLNVKGYDTYDLGWAKGVLVTNFQLDGRGTSGKNSVYADDLTVYKW